MTSLRSNLECLITKNTRATAYPLKAIGTGSISADAPGVSVLEVGVFNNRPRLRVYIYTGVDIDGDKATEGLATASIEIVQYLKTIVAFPGGNSDTAFGLQQVGKRQVYAATVDVVTDIDGLESCD